MPISWKKIEVAQKKRVGTEQQLKALTGLAGYGLLPRSRVRIWPFIVFISMVVLLLTGRLTQLTLVEGAYQRQQADANRILAIRTAAQRGIFLTAKANH